MFLFHCICDKFSIKMTDLFQYRELIFYPSKSYDFVYSLDSNGL
jgi:hypothetical protein